MKIKDLAWNQQRLFSVGAGTGWRLWVDFGETCAFLSSSAVLNHHLTLGAHFCSFPKIISIRDAWRGQRFCCRVLLRGPAVRYNTSECAKNPPVLSAHCLPCLRAGAENGGCTGAKMWFPSARLPLVAPIVSRTLGRSPLRPSRAKTRRLIVCHVWSGLGMEAHPTGIFLRTLSSHGP